MTGTARRERWIGQATLALLALGFLACAGGGAAGPATRSIADLTNPFLGPEYSQWLVGPIAGLASPQEIEAYLALRDDAAARELIERFWGRLDPSPDKPGNPLREAFERRGAEADRLYSEAGFLGRRTARGSLHVLYGRPRKIEFEVPRREGEPPIEVWLYGQDAPSGLDSRRPAPLYRFVKRGDLTVLYVPREIDERFPGRRQDGGLD